MLRAVLFDVDFTLFRPGPELGPDGYVRWGARHGLALDPERYEPARLAALDDLAHHPELEHDIEIWVRFTRDIVEGMGGVGETSDDCARAIVGEWEKHENFFLYDDALPAIAELRRHGLRLGLVSNGQRDLDEFAEHHELDVDVCVGSKHHGYVKPHRSIFETALAALDVTVAEAVMVGDSPSDDIAGAKAVGLRAILLDRDGRFSPGADVIPTLLALPAALGLQVA
ncbi:MAG: HAD family hydrolase [Gaiellales bacterium]